MADQNLVGVSFNPTSHEAEHGNTATRIYTLTADSTWAVDDSVAFARVGGDSIITKIEVYSVVRGAALAFDIGYEKAGGQPDTTISVTADEDYLADGTLAAAAGSKVTAFDGVFQNSDVEGDNWPVDLNLTITPKANLTSGDKLKVIVTAIYLGKS